MMQMLPEGLSLRRRLLITCLAGGILVVLTIVLAIPAYRILFPSCLFHDLTGMSCLTCGLTRSLQATAHGDLPAAFQYHLLGPFLFAGAVAGVITCVMEASAGKRWVLRRQVSRLKPALFALLAVWLICGAVRMVIELAR